MTDLDDEIDALYVVAPEKFVAARTALAKERAAAGDKKGAAAVKELRRPSVVAWALNKAARDRAKDVRELADVARALRAAQKKALTGAATSGLKQATAARGALVQRLAVAASAVLEDSGREPAPHRQAITNTLLAASTDPDLAEELARGRLVAELQVGDPFAALLGASVAAAADDDAPRAKRSREDEDEDEDDGADVVDLDAHRAKRTGKKAARRDDDDKGAKQDARARIAEAKRKAADEERARIAEEKRRRVEEREAATARREAARAAVQEAKRARDAAAAEVKRLDAEARLLAAEQAKAAAVLAAAEAAVEAAEAELADAKA